MSSTTPTSKLGSSMDSARNWSRRTFVLRGACGLAFAAGQARRSAHSDTPLRLDDMESDLGGRIGGAAIDTGNGARLAHRGDERFAMCSTFKWMLAAAVLAQHDHGGKILGQHLSYGPKGLLAPSPVTQEIGGGWDLPLPELSQPAVEARANSAADILS